MSMILDALQRADRERRQQEPAVPSLNDTPAPPPKPRRRLWWAVGGVALVAASGLAAFLLTRPTAEPVTHDAMPQPQTQAPTEPTQTAQQAPARNRATTGKAATQPAEAPDIARLYQSRTGDDSSVAELYRKPEKQTTESPVPASENERLADPTTAETAAANTASVPERSSETASEPATTANADGAGMDAERAAPPNTGDPAMASIRDLPWNLQQSLPSLNYQSHDYREGGASQVVINGKRLRGGDRIAPELVLERIDRDGVVLRYQGYEFKLNALSSWVNM